MMFHVLILSFLRFTTRGVLCAAIDTQDDLFSYAHQAINRFGDEFEKKLDSWLSQVFNTPGGFPAAVSPASASPAEMIVELPLSAPVTENNVAANDVINNNNVVNNNVDKRVNTSTLSDSTFYSIFDKLRDFIRDPLLIPDEKLMHSGNIPDKIVIFAVLKDAKIEGLSKYNVTYIKIDSTPLSMFENLKWDNLLFNGNYELDITNPAIHIYGNGPFRINFTNVMFGTNVTLSEKENYFSLDDFKLDLKVSNATVRLENLMDGGMAGEMVNAILSDLTPKAFATLLPTIKSVIERNIINRVNQSLGTLKSQTLRDLFKLYASF